MVYHHGYFLVWHKSLDLIGQLSGEGGFVVDGNVGNDIDRDATLFLEVVETVNLHDFLVLGQGLHHFLL